MIGAIALIATAMLAGTAGTAAAAERGSQAAAGEWVCPGTPVPPLYVTTDYNRNGCNGLGAWYQEPVRDGIWACSGSTVAPGYV
ncbi:hypothetical protein HCK01_32345, partial [Streptomyces sp. AA8]|nr:hypothetical protein [Streptomyces telluris]